MTDFQLSLKCEQIQCQYEGNDVIMFASFKYSGFLLNEELIIHNNIDKTIKKHQNQTENVKQLICIDDCLIIVSDLASDVYNVAEFTKICSLEESVCYANQNLIGTTIGHVYTIQNEQIQLLLELDSEIIQIKKLNDENVIVSTLTKLVHFSISDPLQYKQVGTRPRKNTRQGGCFTAKESQQILACRPNCKVFVYDTQEAAVIQTINLKETAQTYILFDDLIQGVCKQQQLSNQDFELGTLYHYSQQFYFCCCDDKLLVIDVDLPGIVSIIQFSNKYQINDTNIIIQRKHTSQILVGQLCYNKIEEKTNIFQKLKSGFQKVTPDVIKKPQTEEKKQNPQQTVEQVTEIQKQQEPELIQDFEDFYSDIQLQYDYIAINKEHKVEDLIFSVIKKKVVNTQTYISKQPKSPLIYFFPYMVEEVDQNKIIDQENIKSIEEISQYIAQQANDTNSLNIQKFNHCDVNLTKFQVIQEADIKQLNNLIVNSNKYIQTLLETIDQKDQLYYNVKYQLQGLYIKSVLTLAAFSDISYTPDSSFEKAIQPLYPEFQLNDYLDNQFVINQELTNSAIFNNIQPHPEFVNQIINRFKNIKFLLNSYCAYYSGLIFHIPQFSQLVEMKVDDKDNENQYLCCQLLENSCKQIENQVVQLLQFLNEQVQNNSTSKQATVFQIIEDVVQFAFQTDSQYTFQFPKFINILQIIIQYGDFLHNEFQSYFCEFITLYFKDQLSTFLKTQQFESIDKNILNSGYYLILSLVSKNLFIIQQQKINFISTIFLFVAILTKSLNILETQKQIIKLFGQNVYIDNAINEIKHNSSFIQSLHQFVNNNITQYNNYCVFFIILQQIGLQCIFINIYAQSGYVDQTLQFINQNTELDEVLVLFKSLINSTSAKNVIQKFRDQSLINKQNLQQFVKICIGLVDFKFLYNLCKDFDQLNANTLRMLSQVAEYGAVLE